MYKDNFNFEKVKLSQKKSALSLGKYKDKIDFLKDNSNLENIRASFIIVAYNEGNLVLRCIESILKQRGDAPFEIILVDNGLDKETADKLKNYNIFYIKTKRNLGPSSGRNIASLHAKGEIIISIDADGYIGEGYLQKALEGMGDSEIIAARGKVVPIENNKGFLRSATPIHYDLGNDEQISLIDTEGDFIIIPHGTRHRPVCKQLVKCLLIEVQGTLNKSNTGGTYEE